MTERCTTCNGKGQIALDQGDELPRRLIDCPHCNSFAAVKAGRMTDMDHFIEAADALAGECNRIAPVIGEALDALGMGDPHGVATSNKFRVTLDRYRAAREAIMRGTPPATSA